MFFTILNLTTTTTMKTTFTNINWRNLDDSNVFNMHAIKSIELDTDSNIVTITCATNTFSAPFYGLTYGGGGSNTLGVYNKTSLCSRRIHRNSNI